MCPAPGLFRQQRVARNTGMKTVTVVDMSGSEPDIVDVGIADVGQYAVFPLLIRD